MKLEQLMSLDLRTCSPSDTLDCAARIMWERDCGFVPIVASDRAVGVITDRDICMAAYTQGQPLGSMLVSSASSHGIMTARESDSIDAAEAMMQKHQLRRIPVVDANGKPIGIVSMNDLARHAQRGGRRPDGLSAESIVRTLAAVCQPSAVQNHVAG